MGQSHKASNWERFLPRSVSAGNAAGSHRPAMEKCRRIFCLKAEAQRFQQATA